MKRAKVRRPPPLRELLCEACRESYDRAHARDVLADGGVVLATFGVCRPCLSRVYAPPAADPKHPTVTSK